MVSEVINIAIRNSKLSSCKPDIDLFDIMMNNSPNFDLWMCYSILFYFFFRDIRKSSYNFSRSFVKFILLPLYKEQSAENKNVATGDVRHLDLLKLSFKLINKKIFKRLDYYILPAPPGEISLSTRKYFIKMLSR